MNFTCLRCGSPRTQSLEAVHLQGQRQYRGSATSLLVYKRSLGVKTTSSRGHSQSTISALAAPPVAPTTARLQSLWTPAALVVAFLLGGWPAFGLVVGGLLVIAVLRGKAEGPAHATAMVRWRSTFYCHRCGETFKVANHPVGEAAPSRSWMPACDA